MEVRLDAQTIHLDQHLRHEQTKEDKLCIDWREEGEREKERREGGREEKAGMRRQKQRFGLNGGQREEKIKGRGEIKSGLKEGGRKRNVDGGNTEHR